MDDEPEATTCLGCGAGDAKSIENPRLFGACEANKSIEISIFLVVLTGGFGSILDPKLPGIRRCSWR